MNIDQIKGNNYSPKKSDKSSSSSKTNRTDAGSGSSKSDAPKKNEKATNLSLTGSTFENEIAFTKKVLGNARKQSFASLKAIKQKINAGAYNSEEVHQKISSLISEDISKIQDIIAKPAPEDQSNPTLSTEHKRNLLENPEITKKVADKIANDLSRL